MIKTMKTFDLHTHSLYSDGSDTPSEIVQKAKENGIDTLALTDHDTIDGLKEAREESQRLKINFINGIELSTRYEKNRLIHILGLDIDVSQTDFQANYITLKKNREAALAMVIDHLQNQGIPIQWSDLENHRTGDYLDRQSVAKWLLKNNYAPTIPRAWIDILDSIAYAPKELSTVQEAFDLIHAGKGQAFIAHIHKPIGLYGYSDEDIFLRLKQLKKQGLDGIESFYPSYTQADKSLINTALEKLDLFQSGGSDYHGKNRPDIDIGQIS